MMKLLLLMMRSSLPFHSIPIWRAIMMSMKTLRNRWLIRQRMQPNGMESSKRITDKWKGTSLPLRANAKLVIGISRQGEGDKNLETKRASWLWLMWLIDKPKESSQNALRSAQMTKLTLPVERKRLVSIQSSIQIQAQYSILLGSNWAREERRLPWWWVGKFSIFFLSFF